MKVAVALLLLAVSASAVHLDFNSLSGWEHSSDAKYTGKFALETPDGLSKPALKASRRRRWPSPARRGVDRASPPANWPGVVPWG